ncbi:MAG: peptide-methionine (S)-S-oxide reductase MsrA [Erysipelotrichaceae bacterium]|nr:peptide-methionine (S)-S-oxide reductase MsrA [Erysipelotrichaceae bacterium]
MEKTAYFAGGCFWCITPIFVARGAKKVTAGYCGGEEKDAYYKAVKSQTTGHRETIAITYDEDRISYDKLLQIFLANIDPYDEGGQFIDRGPSYTTAIYYNDETEKEKALKAIKNLETKTGKSVMVKVEPFKSFYEAEEEHQDYYLKNPEAFEEELIQSGRKK